MRIKDPEELRQAEYDRMRDDINKHFEREFDLNSLDGINSIPVKKYVYRDEVLGNIAYVLQRKATMHKGDKRMDLAIACLRKSNEIMPISGITWSPKDYERLDKFLKMDGQFNEARKEKKNIERKYTGTNDIGYMAWKQTLKNCKELGYRHVYMHPHNSTCAECSKHQNRIYSINGEDKRFPKLPDVVLQTGKLHEGCRHSFSGYDLRFYTFTVYNPLTGKDEEKDPITYSNRPYIDERTPQDIENYDKYIGDIKQEAIDRADYDLYREHLPDIAPKSFGGYRRMKNANSKNYQKLLEVAYEKGIHNR